MARASGSFVDALRTIGVLGALLIASFFVGQIMTVKPDRPASTVDVADAVEGARRVATFDVFGPRSLPKGWVATSARFRADGWHLGVLTTDNDYIGLEQERAKPATIVADHAPKSRSVGTVRLGGLLWSARTERDGDRVYVLDLGESTVLIVGSAPKPVIEGYVASLSEP